MSNLVIEMLLRLIKPLLAVLLGGLVYWIATGPLEAPGSVELGIISILCGAAFILLILELDQIPFLRRLHEQAEPTGGSEPPG